jgi:hypothetical protein
LPELPDYSTGGVALLRTICEGDRVLSLQSILSSGIEWRVLVDALNGDRSRDLKFGVAPFQTGGLLWVGRKCMSSVHDMRFGDGLVMEEKTWNWPAKNRHRERESEMTAR